MNEVLFEYRFSCDPCDFNYTSSNDNDVLDSPCPKCGALGLRVAGSLPTIGASISSDKWNKNRESHMRKEALHNERHGTYNLAE